METFQFMVEYNGYSYASIFLDEQRGREWLIDMLSALFEKYPPQELAQIQIRVRKFN